MISFALDRASHGLQNNILDPYERLILSIWFYFGKIWKFMEKRPFFRADMAGLGKYCMGGYGRIGVYRLECVGATDLGSALTFDLLGLSHHKGRHQHSSSLAAVKCYSI